MRYNANGILRVTVDDAAFTAVALRLDSFIQQETNCLSPHVTMMTENRLHNPVRGTVMDVLLRYAGIDEYECEEHDDGTYVYILALSEWRGLVTDATVKFLAESGCGVEGDVYGEEEDAWYYDTHLGDYKLKEGTLTRIRLERKNELEHAWDVLMSVIPNLDDETVKHIRDSVAGNEDAAVFLTAMQNVLPAAKE